MSILLQKNVGDYSYMSSPNIYYRANKKRQISEIQYVNQSVAFSISSNTSATEYISPRTVCESPISIKALKYVI